LLRSAVGARPVETRSLRRSQAPQRDGNVITWRSAPLGVSGTWCADTVPIAAPLLDNEDGTIQWNCLMPRADARVTCGDETWAGHGYVEMLHVTISPNRLPFRTLRWGRHLSERHAVVWIEWEGEIHRRWVWVDGVQQAAACLTATGLDLGDGRTIRFSASRDLRNQPVEANLPAAAAPVRRRLRLAIGGMQEHKLLSRSSLLAADGAPLDTGWTIHEEVTW
ncbi:MAG: hypothetical protein JNJ98_09165, partial [Gemmatimonadetes bacterium]|nr:hypothetical protein [Gemmatimonadota bacterium]